MEEAIVMIDWQDLDFEFSVSYFFENGGPQTFWEEYNPGIIQIEKVVFAGKEIKSLKQKIYQEITEKLYEKC